MKKISIATGCYNEEENVEELYNRIKAQLAKFNYDYEIIFIDNNSTDNTQDKLRLLSKQDKNVKIILNSRNFGHIRSPFYGLMQSTGDASIFIASDLQDPPELIPEFIKKWEEGYKVVISNKVNSKESLLFSFARKIFYFLISKIADDNTKIIRNFNGFGLYDKKIIDLAKEFDDPYPYFRGIIAEIGFEIAKVDFVQPQRKRGFTKNNFYTLYDNAMLGITKHSKVPLRIMAFSGFILSFLSLFVAIGYLIAKLLFWNDFAFGIAPIIISVFFFSSVQLFFMGILGEYIGAIYTKINKRPLIIEKERINF